MVEPTKLKPRFAEIFAHGVGLRCAGGQVFRAMQASLQRFAANELPDIAVEAPECFLYSEECVRVLNCRPDLQPVAHNTRIRE